jgi:hypothetical protein
VVERCPLEMNGLFTWENLNIFPLGSYDVLIGMDWLEAHQVKLDCYNKTFDCIDEDGNPRIVRGIPKEILLGIFHPCKLKKCFRKGCQLYATHILDSTEDKGPNLEDYLVLQDFSDVFPDEVPGLPPKRDIDFTIDLVPRATPMSKTPYRMSTPELLELKMQLQELLENKYI